MTRAPVDSGRLSAEHEPEFGGWTCWVADDDDGCTMRTCLMRLRDGPRVFKSEAHALRAGRRWLRTQGKDVSAAGAEEE